MASQQERLYALLEKLQNLAKHIPLKFQQRLPNEILSTLAAALVEGQIFDIVRALTEVQHATEKQLFHKRIEMQKKLQDEKRNFDKAYQERICNAATADVLALTASLDGQRKELVARQAADLQKFDAELILQLDQKVTEQQITLEQAGVPGFKVTNNPTDIQVQMHLINFIMMLDPKDSQQSHV